MCGGGGGGGEGIVDGDRDVPRFEELLARHGGGLCDDVCGVVEELWHLAWYSVKVAQPELGARGV